MSRPWFALLKALLNVNFGLSALRDQIRTRRRLWELGAVALGLLVGGGSIVFMVVAFARSFIDAGLAMGQPEIVLTLAHLGAAVIVFTFGLAFVMGAMYFAGDTAMLLAWPLRPVQIVSAKFVTVLINEYLTMAVLLVPVYVLYAIKVPVSGWYIPAAILTFIFTPMLPLALATLVTMVLMRVVGGSRKRDFFTMVGGIAGIAIALSLQYFLQGNFPDGATEAEIAQALFARAHGISEVLSAGYPPGFWGMQSMAAAGSAAGWLALLKLAAAGILLFVALLVVGERVFIRSLQAGGESAVREGKRDVDWSAGSAVNAVARVERKLFMRTPIYVLNGFAGFIIVPVLLLLPLGDSESIRALLQQSGLSVTAGALIVAAWFAAGTGLSVIAPTAFSREGDRLWIVKTLPIPGRTLFVGKLKGDYMMNVLGALPGALVLSYLLGLPLVASLVGIAFGLSLALLVCLICMIIDMNNPKLNWTDPTRAVKSNANVLLSMLATVVLIGGPTLLGFWLARRGVSVNLLTAAAIVVSILANLGLWQFAAAKADDWLARMGDA